MNQVSWCHKVNETRTEKWSLGRARFRSLVTLMSKMVDETWLAWIEGGFEKRMEKIRNVDYTAECPGRSHSTWKDAISRSWTTYFASPCPIFPICRMQVIIRTSVALKNVVTNCLALLPSRGKSPSPPFDSEKVTIAPIHRIRWKQCSHA